MLPCVTATPRGRLVDPDVYCKKATVSQPAFGFFQLPASAAETVSTAITNGARWPLKTSFHASAKALTISDVVSTMLHSASLSSSASLGSACFSLPRCAGYVVTAIAPAYRQP